MTMTFIASNVVTAGNQNSFYTFSSIPQTFSHLQLRVFARSTNSATDDYFGIGYNGDMNNTYYYQHALVGNGSTVISGGSQTAGSFDIAGGTSTASVFAVGIVDILDYTSTVKNKTRRIFAGRDYNGSGMVQFVSGLNFNTPTGITSLSVFTSSNFAIGTRIDLYGIGVSEQTGA